jgi:hypothetical protein
VTERGLREYADAVRARYREASKAEKGRILDEYCRTTAVHRKAAIRRLRAAGGGGGGRGGRPRQYGRELVAALERLWEVSGRLCGKLWVAWLTTALPALELHGAIALRAWHSDNGGELLNRALVDWCRRHGVAVTRERSYRKNDQAWVEQKNGLIVRRLVGYDRLASRGLRDAPAALSTAPPATELLPAGPQAPQQAPRRGQGGQALR